MNTRTMLSLVLLLSTGLLYGEYKIEIALFKDNIVIDHKVGPTKAGDVIVFEQGVEVRIIEYCPDCALVRVDVMNEKCPMSKKQTKCSNCDRCKDCDQDCPQACKECDCCAQECAKEMGQTLHSAPYGQEVVIKCPKCKYSIKLVINRDE